MSLLTNFPHRIDVDAPTVTQSAVTKGTKYTWASSATSVPCQVTAAGGSVQDTNGGDKLIDRVTVDLTQAALQHGYRFLWNGSYFLVDGGNGRIEGIGGIPTRYNWTGKAVKVTE